MDAGRFTVLGTVAFLTFIQATVRSSGEGRLRFPKENYSYVCRVAKTRGSFVCVDLCNRPLSVAERCLALLSLRNPSKKIATPAPPRSTARTRRWGERDTPLHSSGSGRFTRGGYSGGCYTMAAQEAVVESAPLLTPTVHRDTSDNSSRGAGGCFKASDAGRRMRVVGAVALAACVAVGRRCRLNSVVDPLIESVRFQT